jgi:hypothetical protein
MLHRGKICSAFLVFAAFFVTLFGAGRSFAHDLAIDQLRLFPDTSAGHLRGQVLFDPKLTRANNDEGRSVIAPRVVRFLRENVRIEVNGKPVELSFEVRELWTVDGATGGDSVVLDAAMPRRAREMRVFVSPAFRALAVTVQVAGSKGSAAPESTLLLGGDWTPPYRFAVPRSSTGWAEGDPDLLAAKVPPHRDAASAPDPAQAADVRPPTTLATGAFAPSSAWQTAVRYVKLGVAHILPHGWDHVLFVAALVLGSRRRLRALFLQLGAFTVAHTVTLGLGALGLVVLPGTVIEPLIAFSIAFVAVENLVRKGEPRYRAGWAFAFGLLHGQGFAGALAETGLPRESFLTALLSFNVGVEIGQVLVVGALLVAFHGLKDADRFHRYAIRPGSLVIAMAGLYWAVERLTA